MYEIFTRRTFTIIKHKDKEAKIIYAGNEDSVTDILWRTGYKSHSQFILVDIAGEMYLFVSSLEAGLAHKEAKVKEVINVYEYKKQKGFTQNKRVPMGRLLRLFLKEKGVSRVILSPFFPAKIKDDLGRFFKITWREKSMYPERQIKSEVEIGYIREAQEAISQCFARVCNYLKNYCVVKDGYIIEKRSGKSVTSEMVKKRIKNFLDKKGFDVPKGSIVASGKETAYPHLRGEGALHAHAPIIIDIFPQSRKTGYWGDFTRTVFKGRPSTEIEKLYKTVYDAQMLGIDLMASGKHGDEIHKQILTLFNKKAYKTRESNKTPEGFIHNTGHGLGLELHEFPALCVVPDKPRVTRIHEGNTVTIEPGLYYEKLGGIRIEDVVVKRKNGAEVLGNAPKDFESMVL